MLVICPQCQAENEDVARFCNQCGAALGNSLPENRPVAATPQPAAQSSAAAPGINWTALIVLVLVLGAGWFMFGMKHDNTGEAGMAGGAAPMMEQILKQVGDLKARLADDPGDVATITEMYELYGQVGKTAEVTPYTQAALEHIVANGSSMEQSELGDKLLALFIAAYEHQDDQVCVEILTAYHEVFPENVRILKVLGDLSYDSMQWEEAIDYYGQYTAAAVLDDDRDNYLNAMTDMGSCYIQLAGDLNPNREHLNSAAAKFREVLSLQPDFWQAHYNLGVTHGKLEDQDTAISEWEWCRDNTDSEMEKWRAEYAIAEIRGEELPPMPSSPHGEGFGSMDSVHGEGGMMNPHGEGGMTNPHGEGGGMAPPLDGNNLPPNPHSEEFLQEHSETEGSASESSEGSAG
ncbi:MAG: zinc-ribbon domain-containing protein [bacterium]